MQYWCEYAWLGGDEVTAGVVLDVQGDRIHAVNEGPAPPAATRLAGVTLPGLVNVHSHAFHRLLRGRTHDSEGSFWTWRQQMYELAAALDPGRYRAVARAVFGEMVLAGITTVGEFHYLHHQAGGQPYADPNEMGEALLAAAADAGLRITLLDTCYLRGGVGRAPDEVQRRFADRSVESWAARTDLLRPGPAAHLGAAIHSVRALEPLEMAEVASEAAHRSWPLHAHVSEQPAENEACLAAYGLTPTGVLHDVGALGPRFTAVHATHVTDGDIGQLAAGHVCLCPTTERDLADGVGPAAAFAGAGAHLCLGSDSHAVIDLFEEARAVELDERLVTGRRGHHRPRDLLVAATSGAPLGWADAGELRAGALADFVTVGLDGVRLAGTPANALVPAVVFAATAADVGHVVVGGRVMVQEGRHTTLDVPAELAAVSTLG